MSPHEANEALMSRLSYSASIRIRRQKTNHKTARTALMFCVLVSRYIFFFLECCVMRDFKLFLQWFFANYLFQLALEPTETAMVTLLSSTSSFFTLILAALFPSSNGDKFTLSKLTTVILSIGGVVSVSIGKRDQTFSSLHP